MGEENKRRLEQQLWNIANTLRGKMDADEFRDYILGFIFYKYLSEKMVALSAVDNQKVVTSVVNIVSFVTVVNTCVSLYAYF